MVLRASYRLDATLIAACLRCITLMRWTPCLPSSRYKATRRDDFADALHAAQRRDGESFVTFDRQLARRAPKAGVLAVALLKG